MRTYPLARFIDRESAVSERTGSFAGHTPVYQQGSEHFGARADAALPPEPIGDELGPLTAAQHDARRRDDGVAGDRDRRVRAGRQARAPGGPAAARVER